MTSREPLPTLGASKSTSPPEFLRHKPFGRIALSIGLFALFGWLVIWIASNPAFSWDTVAKYFTAPAILAGLAMTLLLTAIVFILGFLLGGLLTAMHLSRLAALQTAAWFYVWLFRSVPLLVQLLFWFNIASLIPVFSFGIPFMTPIVSVPANQLITPIGAAIVGLTLHEAAYACEVIRGGFLSVDPGQREAATALSLGRWNTTRYVLLPQAMRSILPAAGNQLIGLLKGTSMVSVIAVPELLYAAQSVYNRTFQVMPLLVVASIWYIVVTSVLSLGQHYVERRFSRGSERTEQKSFAAQIRAFAKSMTTQRREDQHDFGQ